MIRSFVYFKPHDVFIIKPTKWSNLLHFIASLGVLELLWGNGSTINDLYQSIPLIYAVPTLLVINVAAVFVENSNEVISELSTSDRFVVRATITNIKIFSRHVVAIIAFALAFVGAYCLIGRITMHDALPMVPNFDNYMACLSSYGDTPIVDINSALSKQCEEKYLHGFYQEPLMVILSILSAYFLVKNWVAFEFLTTKDGEVYYRQESAADVMDKP